MGNKKTLKDLKELKEELQSEEAEILATQIPPEIAESLAKARDEFLAPLQEEYDAVKGLASERVRAWLWKGWVEATISDWMDDPDSDLRTMLDELNALRQDLNTKTRKIDGVNVPKAPPENDVRQAVDVLESKIRRIREVPENVFAGHYGIDPQRAREITGGENSSWAKAKK